MPTETTIITKHPLTLAQIKKLASRYTCDMESGEYSFGEDTVRAAADWQLEKCDDELGNILHCLAIAGKITGEERIQLYVLFKEAMRPTKKH